MAHQVETMAYAGEVPWHGLGVKVIDDLTPDQMLKKAGLDWTVSTRQMYFKNTNKPEYTEIPKRRVLVRDSDETILSTVGDGWKPLQNSEAFDFFNEFVIAGDMKMDTAGSLDDGRMVWGLAKLKDGFTVSKGDDVEGYLLFSNPHKYACSIEVRFTPVRVVCNNTLTYALNQYTQQSARLNHRQVFDAESVKETLGLASNFMQDYADVSKFLASKNYSKDSIKEYYNEVFPIAGDNKRLKDLSRNAEAALETVNTQPGAKLSEGTWWSAFNSVTYLIDHELGVSQDTRLQSAWFGKGRQKKVSALAKAKDYAMAA
jgi:phage/plasmid-like protein (TIGR03299 family)|tara:strand:+ start:333 stop:1280 length:948 start_codon:yes stop_codon:yes gene_type:complete